MKRPRVDVDLRPYYKGEESGHAEKSLIVLHETVSPNYVGLWDIKGPAAYLDSKGYEIHAIIDKEAHSAWCYDPTAIYDHAASGEGMVNTRSIGFELVSEIPAIGSRAKRRELWSPKGDRRRQLDKTAEWIAWLHLKLYIPLRFSDASTPGITTHWNVSRTYVGKTTTPPFTTGHWDCWPVHNGGHFPVLYVINRARKIVEAHDEL